MINRINGTRSLSTGRILATISASAVPVRKKFNEISDSVSVRMAEGMESLRRVLGWRSTVLALEVGILMGGAVVAGSFGWLAMARYSFFVMLAGAVILLVGLAKGYRNMMLATPSEVLYHGTTKSYRSAPLTQEMMNARYAVFMQMVFWLACGIVALLSGAVIQSFL